MDRWSVGEVTKFLSSCSLESDGLELALAHAQKRGVNGHKISQCGSMIRCQDIFKPLRRNQCQAIADRVREHLNKIAPRPPPIELKQDTVHEEELAQAAPITPSLSCVEHEHVADITAIDTAKLTIAEMEWVGGGLGSTGVFICRTNMGTLVAKPTSARTAGEIYASQLAGLMGIHTAKMSFPSDPADHESLISKMRWAKSKNPSDKERLKSLRTQAVVLVEFVHGHAFPACAMVVLAGSHRSRLLYEMGLVMLLDMVVNNFDRVPLVWANDGNLDNLIVSPGTDYPELFAIDHTLTCIKHPDGNARYLQSIEKGLADLSTNPFDCVAMKRVRECLAMFGIELTRDDCDDICDGIRAGCTTLRELQAEQPAWSSTIRTNVLALLGPMGVLCGEGDLVVDFVDGTTATILKSPLAS